MEQVMTHLEICNYLMNYNNKLYLPERVWNKVYGKLKGAIDYCKDDIGYYIQKQEDPE